MSMCYFHMDFNTLIWRVQKKKKIFFFKDSLITLKKFKTKLIQFFFISSKYNQNIMNLFKYLIIFTFFLYNMKNDLKSLIQMKRRFKIKYFFLILNWFFQDHYNLIKYSNFYLNIQIGFFFFFSNLFIRWIIKWNKFLLTFLCINF